MSTAFSNCIFSAQRNSDGFFSCIVKRNNMPLLSNAEVKGIVPFTMSGLKRSTTIEMDLDLDTLKAGSDDSIIMKQGNMFMDSLLMISADVKTDDRGDYIAMYGYVFYEAPEDSIIQLVVDFPRLPMMEHFTLKLCPEFGVARILDGNRLLGESQLNGIPSEKIAIRKPTISSFLSEHLQLGEAVKSMNIYDINAFSLDF